MGRVIGGYIIAVLATYLVGTTLISQGNLANVAAMGATIEWPTRFDAMIHDALHMYEIYLPLVAISFLIAFTVAALIIRRLPNLRLVGYVLAGFVGLMAIHLLMKAVLGMTGVAPTRTLAGLLGQGFAGAVGGYVFHLVTAKGTNARAADSQADN
jgi:hypothetical protein